MMVWGAALGRAAVRRGPGGKVVAGVAAARVPVLIVWRHRVRSVCMDCGAYRALPDVRGRFEAQIGAVDGDFTRADVVEVADVASRGGAPMTLFLISSCAPRW